MKPLVFAIPGNEHFALGLAHHLGAERGRIEIHQFPDGESCPRLHSAVAGRNVVMVCTLDRPDKKIMSLYLSACVARELGAASVGLVVPYLPYMRQDARFQEGEGITSQHFARLLSSCCDYLVTVDPHLHRHHALSDIYSVPSRVVHAAPEIAKWIAAKVERPVVVGPDGESEQWVAQVARLIGYTVLHKNRSGDRNVEVSMPDTSAWSGMTPVLVDDIVSTARTMVAAAVQIESARMAAPVCIAVHPLFAGGAYAALHLAGVERIVSCNTVEHSTNRIHLCQAAAVAVQELINERNTVL